MKILLPVLAMLVIAVVCAIVDENSTLTDCIIAGSLAGILVAVIS